jgi:hypothetical protein
MRARKLCHEKIWKLHWLLSSRLEGSVGLFTQDELAVQLVVCAAAGMPAASARRSRTRMGLRSMAPPDWNVEIEAVDG